MNRARQPSNPSAAKGINIYRLSGELVGHLPDTQDNDLFGVTCASASECWSVGYYYDPITHINHTLIDRWDGTSWSIVNSPDTSANRDNLLFGVTCVSASDCWAVGNYYNDSDAAQTLALRYVASALSMRAR